jgi:hypothetical protein
MLMTSFVPKALYYFPDIERSPLPAPIEILAGEAGGLIDVTQNAQGEVYLASLGAIYHLVFPMAGDANGDGKVESTDADAIARELLDEGPHATILAQSGSYAASWGADVNGDGMIDARDLIAFASVHRGRLRGARR